MNVFYDPESTEGVDLKEIANEIFEINKAHGFYEPLPEPVVAIAESYLKDITNIIKDFESIRKSTEFDYSDSDVIYHGQLRFFKVKLLLVISEIIELIEELDKFIGNKPLEDEEDLNDIWFKHDEEVADVFIRMLDFAGGLQVNIDKAIEAKMEKNRNRPYKHNRNF